MRLSIPYSRILKAADLMSCNHQKTITCLITLLILAGSQASAINRVSVTTGNFTNPATWNPAGIPLSGDQVTIQNGHTITVDNNSEAGQLTIANGGKLTFSATKKLTLYSHFHVFGNAEIIDGDLSLITPGSSFTIGATGSLTWSPANNTVAGASLFLNGNEYFHPASNLVIKKWYNYSNVPLGSVVTGNFGNLTLNTLTAGLLYEWNQNNEFENHIIQGTLTIDQGWVVLDKSGTISNTTIGAIYLNNINSYLDVHSGNHPGSFTLATGTITNIGGKINGLYNGDGNFHLNVNGDFTNLGNVMLIYNSGIQGIANGNASIQVAGKYYQTTGDFRGIFNISSTTSGKVDLEFGEIKLTGGIFMGQYACHTSGNNSNIQINGNLEIDFNSPNSKFRGNGLTTLTGISNNLSMQLMVEGDLIVKGPLSAEFTSSGSTGPETTVIKGTSIFEGCTSNFNFGSHSTTLSLYENMEVSGGTVYFSRTNGTLTVLLQKNLILQNGNLSITGGTGNSNLIINGDYYQTGGSMFFHNNNSIATPNIIYATVHGNFFNHSGNITFDNNSATTAQHILSLNGETCTIGGNATINSTVSASIPMYGIIHYDRQGEMQYTHSGTGTILHDVKQVINSECYLKVISGNIQVAESIKPSTDMLLVSSNGILDLGEKQMYGNTLNLYTSFQINEDGRLRISHPNGLYNGSGLAAINAAGNMIFRLHEKSIVEYYGVKSQTITGTGLGNATTAEQQYGILEINKTRKSAALNGNQVFARTALVLSEGELNLNGFNITLNSGAPSAIIANGGYIRSEGTSTGTSSMVKWKNIAPGTHTIPFGTSTVHLLPFSFTPVSGFGNEFAVSTRSTGSDNRPLSHGVTHLNFNGKEAGIEKLIDRWFHVTAQGIKADITGTYLAEENTTSADLADKNFSFICWTGTNWKLLGGAGNGSTSEPGSVTTNSINNWGPMLLVSNEKTEAADLLSFSAKLIRGQVEVEWTAVSNTAPEKYTIERSQDEYQFNEIIDKTALPASSSPISYHATDRNPYSGISYYRLIQHQPDGNKKYSLVERIDNSKMHSTGIEIESVNPNPFNGVFTATYFLQEDGEIEVRLTGSNGQIIYSQFMQNSAGRNSFVFSKGNQLTPGIYILTVSNGTSSKNLKLFHI